MATKNTKSRPATSITTGRVRFSYVHIFEPYAFDSSPDRPQYSMAVLIDKEDKATLGKVRNAIRAAVEEGKESRWKGKKPNLWNPLRDGDEERPDQPEYAGKMFLNAKSKNRPGVVDRNLQEILDAQEVYSGCYGRVSLSFFPFAVSGNYGVGVGLNNVQKLADGEPLGGKTNPEDDFDDDFEDDFEDDEDEFDDIF